jgi:hypothetical protein
MDKIAMSPPGKMTLSCSDWANDLNSRYVCKFLAELEHLSYSGAEKLRLRVNGWVFNDVDGNL